jgi:glycosyltransferase involved in cell wall biosynthesis
LPQRISKRIAIVSSVPSYPADAGNRARVHRIVTDLQQLGHEVHLIFVDDVAADLDAMRVALDGNLHVVHNERPPFRNPRRFRALERVQRWRGRAFGMQYLTDVDGFVSEALMRRVRELAREIRPDVAIAVYPFYSSLLEAFDDDVWKLLDTLDRFANRQRQLWHAGLENRFVATSARAERRALARADRVLAITEEEQRYFERRTATPVATLGHRVEIERLPAADPDAAPRLAYLAGANRLDRPSLHWLADRVLPRLRRRFPDLELLVAGGIGDYPDLPRGPGVRIVGRVEDLGKFYERAHVFVNPRPAGTGLHVRNLEALGCGRPTVMHRNAARGLRHGEGEAFLTARSAAGFARQIGRILERPALARRLSAAALDFMEAYDARVQRQLRDAVGPA